MWTVIVRGEDGTDFTATLKTETNAMTLVRAALESEYEATLIDPRGTKCEYGPWSIEEEQR